MSELADVRVAIESGTPILALKTEEEHRAVTTLAQIAVRLGRAAFRWSVVEGLRRFDREGFSPQATNADPKQLLANLKATTVDALYLLLDFHPYLDEPFNVRMLKEIALGETPHRKTIILISHELSLPPELKPYAMEFSLSLPGESEVRTMVEEIAESWQAEQGGQQVKTSKEALDLLIDTLLGLPASDVRRLARTAIYDDGVICQEDAASAMRAKVQLINQDSLLCFEYDTTEFSQVAGLTQLKKWLEQRKRIFRDPSENPHLDPPRGVLLLGVQGCGKSLAAKAVAGSWQLPLLRLDFGVLYNKFIGETEKNLRDALSRAALLEPCILWLDEIEKGVAADQNDGGTSQRVLGTLLTWMAERKSRVFMVATANAIDLLPPELLRKGRFDEIFFVDLPPDNVRKEIFKIHLEKRSIDIEAINLNEAVSASQGFSGAEIETAIVSALYAAHADETALSSRLLLTELQRTKPLSVTMAERIASLRNWASERTVAAD